MRRNQERKNLNANKKESINHEELNFRFKSSLKLNMKDGLDNEQLVGSSEITETRKVNSSPEDQETEIRPTSANAGSEYVMGFLFWSFMNFGADNAIGGKPAYWLSKANQVHDYWTAIFDSPKKIDVVEISWRYLPKRMKIFYKLDESKDWIGATETYTLQANKKGEQKKNKTTYTIYFKRSLLCKQFKIMMNEPINKNCFGINKVLFYTKINRGMIKVPLLDKSISNCWIINTNVLRKYTPIYVYPCTEGISDPNSTEVFQILPNSQIKPHNSELCVDYDRNTKNLILNECSYASNASKIFYNDDYSMYFNDLKGTPIAVETERKNINFINEKTEVIASSEADSNEFKKENMLNNGGSQWESAAGKLDVTVQLFFGKIKCEDCSENGKFESRRIDSIVIKWSKEPTKFSIYLWNPGQSWKKISSFVDNKEKITNISLIQESAAAIMIKISDGNKYIELGNQVAYGINSIGAYFNASPLILKDISRIPTDKKIFDFESLVVLNKQSGNFFKESIEELGKNYEKSITTYKQMKKSIPEVEHLKKENNEICKKLSEINVVVDKQEIEKLEEFKIQHIQKIENTSFYKYLKEYNDGEGLENILGNDTKKEKEKGFSPSKYNPLTDLGRLLDNKKNGLTSSSISSEPKKENSEESKKEIDPIGSFDNPAPNCLHIKTLNKSSLSGYYFIKPDCGDNPLRVFCDFALFEVAVDIFVYKADSNLQTPNLSYLHLKTAQDIREKCAEVGLEAIQLNSYEMTKRIHKLLIASDMKLDFPTFVPLGYDYSCKGAKCADIFNSINRSTSDPIMKFFDGKLKPQKTQKTSFQFIGLGTSKKIKAIRYDEKNMVISALICSTNITNPKKQENLFRVVDCLFTLNANLDLFKAKENNFICPRGCANSTGEVYGAGTYNGKSSICRAAIHAGEITDDGGKITVRIDASKQEYEGTFSNGVESKILPGEGSKSFILYKYKPDCPKKKISSFITKEENVDLDNEMIMENSLKEGNADIDINSFIDNLSKEKPNNKRNLISNNLIPHLSSIQNKDILNTNDDYRFNQINKSNNYKFPPIGSILQSMPNNMAGGLNSSALAETAATISNLSSQGKGEIMNIGKGLLDGLNKSFNNQQEPDRTNASENLPNSMGKFESPADLYSNSLSSPAANQINYGSGDDKNIKAAMSAAQSFEDPTKVEGKQPGHFEPFSIPKNDESKASPDPPQIVDSELPGTKKQDSEKAMDLSTQGTDAKNQPDPLENTPEKEEGDTSTGNQTDDTTINRDLPTNIDKTKSENTELTIIKLQSIYNDGLFKYLKDMKKKDVKIVNSTNDFVALNTPLFGQKKIEYENCDTGKCFTEGCNITYLPEVYNIILRKSKNIENIIIQLLNRINARIYKTEEIKKQWKKRYADLTDVEGINIDYSIYPNNNVASEIIFKDIFEISKVGNQKVLNPTQWKVISSGIKGRPAVMGVEFPKNDPTGGTSNLVLLDKNYYDFEATFDILLSETGTVSINFRHKDNFNHYSFIVDKKSGNKILSKNINGNMKILQIINDGAISINQWHTVEIMTLANKISVTMYDAENKTNTIKKLEYFDSSFVRGKMAFSVTGVTGFYFDNFKIKPLTCWTPWIPKENLLINNPNTSIYTEEFEGTLESNYTIRNVDESQVKDGPAIWSIKDGGTFESNYIYQENTAFDGSIQKRSNFITLNNKHFQHGTYIVEFQASETKGIISIIFKYYVDESNSVKYYVFELNNERNEPSFDLKFVNGEEILSLMTKNASEVVGLKNKAYHDKKSNLVKINVINNIITVGVAHNGKQLNEVFSTKNDKIQGGLVGFGTYKTPAKFTKVTLAPPKLKMTPEDINKVLTTSPSKLFSEIPFPSPKKIQDLSIENPINTFGVSAYENIKSEISRFASSLGYNFKTNKPSSPASAIDSSNTEEAANKGKNNEPSKEKKGNKVDNINNEDSAWKSCVTTRSVKDRSTWCATKFPAEIIKAECETNFCDSCCAESVSAEKNNIVHMCKKGCYRSSIAVDENKDYINTCVATPNTQQNIYSFCQDRFSGYNPTMLNLCKLDMCNLCCVGMDSIKHKNFSFPNLKSCFLDCARFYNVEAGYNRKNETSDDKDEKLKGKKGCKSPPSFDIDDINNHENVEASFLLENYLRNSNTTITENPIISQTVISNSTVTENPPATQ